MPFNIPVVMQDNDSANLSNLSDDEVQDERIEDPGYYESLRKEKEFDDYLDSLPDPDPTNVQIDTGAYEKKQTEVYDKIHKYYERIQENIADIKKLRSGKKRFSNVIHNEFVEPTEVEMTLEKLKKNLKKYDVWQDELDEINQKLRHYGYDGYDRYYYPSVNINIYRNIYNWQRLLQALYLIREASDQIEKSLSNKAKSANLLSKKFRRIVKSLGKNLNKFCKYDNRCEYRFKLVSRFDKFFERGQKLYKRAIAHIKFYEKAEKRGKKRSREEVENGTEVSTTLTPEIKKTFAQLLSEQIDKELTVSATVKPQEALRTASPFGSKWKKEGTEKYTWFHSVDEVGVKKELDKHLKQIEPLIAGKEVEVKLNEKMLKQKSADIGKLREKQKNSKSELESLQAQKIEYKKYLPENRQVFRRHIAENRFFNPKRSKKRKEIISLTKDIIGHRYREDKTTVPQPIGLNDKSTRLFITAERAYQEAAIALTDKVNPKLNIPEARKKEWKTDEHTVITNYGPVEGYQIGKTVVHAEHRTEPKRQRLGDSYLPQQLGAYNSIYQFLLKLIGKNIENEKRLTCYMLRYGKSHQPISLEELQAIYTPAKQSDVDKFNQICFLIMEKEQAQWHSATEEKYQLGMSVSQARCLIMLEAGYINFEDVFKNNPLFGIYSQTGIIKTPTKVAEACQRIDDLYMAYLQTKNPKDYMLFQKKYIKSTAKPKCILTREQAHQDLKYVYGGESDTDDEGYDTDIDLVM